MDENWGATIRKLREERGLTQTELAKRAHLTSSHISRIESGGYKNSTQKTYEGLASAFGLTVNSLIEQIRGYKIPPRQETSEEILERLRITQPVSVPIYEDFPFHAGTPVNAAEYTPVVRDKARGKRLEGYFVHGDCLLPDIQDGDIIIIDRDGQVDIGNVVACLYQGEVHLGKLRKIADELYLENNHGRFKLDECQVAAPVVEVRRRLK